MEIDIIEKIENFLMLAKLIGYEVKKNNNSQYTLLNKNIIDSDIDELYIEIINSDGLLSYLSVITFDFSLFKKEFCDINKMIDIAYLIINNSNRFVINNFNGFTMLEVGEEKIWEK